MSGIINTILSILLAAAISGGASAMAEVEPQEAADAFFRDLASGNDQVAMAYMDNRYINFLENVKGTDEEMDRLEDAVFRNFSFEITDSAAKNDVAVVKVTVRNRNDEAWTVIEDDHDKIVETGHNGEICNLRNGCDGKAPTDKSTLDYKLTVKEIYSFTKSVAYDDIKFILGDRDLNLALAREGLEGSYGLGVGKAIRENQHEIFGDDFMSFAMGMTAAASDARMAGCKLPAMSNSGSGNQGITVSMPVITYAIKYDVDDERLARALILSNLVAIHIKGYLGKLSALCGCVIASTGSACGIVYLQGGSYDQICATIKNMIGNITGMVCDGAKVGCAMKVASGVSCAIQSAVLALRGKCVCETDGIIDKDIEKTIRNLGEIGSFGMKTTDQLIQRIMVCK